MEYSVSQLMCMYGMEDHAVTHVADIRNRFDGKKRNPYDEPEYGHHYARAMSSWGLIPTLSGFRHDAVSGELTITPWWKITAVSVASGVLIVDGATSQRMRPRLRFCSVWRSQLPEFRDEFKY